MTDEPIPADDALERAESEAAAEAAATDAALSDAAAKEDARSAAGGTDDDDVGRALTSNDYTVAFSPRQVAVGLAIVAGLVALAASRRRRRARRADG